MSEERSLRRNCGPAGTAALFVYGTLTRKAHLRLLLGRDVETESAVLTNYMRVELPGAFSFLVRRRGAETQGLLLKGIEESELARIDAFEDEGHLYFRRRVFVQCSSGSRVRCMTYIGNLSALEKSFGRELCFEDRYRMYVERKIDAVIEKIAPERRETVRRAMRELLGAEADRIVESHFDGNYICNYIMVQSLSDAAPKPLDRAAANPAILPYSDNYMCFACRHMIFNLVAEAVRENFPDAVRVSEHYYRHGLDILLSLMFCNRFQKEIAAGMAQHGLNKFIPGRLYREYAAQCVLLTDEIFSPEALAPDLDEVLSHWYSARTPLGAELEFSSLGVRAVSASPGEDKEFDGFFYFDDFDLARRTWRLGGHVDSHRLITPDMKRTRGFFEYALGRFNILGDLSRPLFDCPWGMSRIINEAVHFSGLAPHSLHISMELPHKDVMESRHRESDLACLLLLGGDLHTDTDGVLREWRIFNGELDTSAKALNFSDRKQHYARPGGEVSDRSDVMEFKFLRLHRETTDYHSVIVALKGYQFATRTRPVTAPDGEKELPEQTFLRSWAEHPQSLGESDLGHFLELVEEGLLREHKAMRLDRRRMHRMEVIEAILKERNSFVANNS